MKKVLLVATVQSHICQFHLPLIDLLHEMNYEVHIAAKNNLAQKKGLKLENADKVFNIDFERSPFKRKNILAYKQLKKVIKENKYDIIHCNTPMGGVITRLIKRNNKNIKSKIIYTAHGFHFFKGAPKINWIVYYPIEKWLSKYTDYLITINKEDYNLAKKKFKHTNVLYIPGIGLVEEKFNVNMDKLQKIAIRKKLNINEKDFVIIYVAELIKRKNHMMILNTIQELIKEKKDIKLLMVGNGILYEDYEKWIIQNKLENNIKMLGYRTDVPELMKISDIAVSTSRQEGLPVNVMEAMISGLPDIVTNCRGNSDLIENEKDGYVIEIDNIEQMKEKILKLYNDKELRIHMGEEGRKNVKQYTLSNIKEKLKKVYIKASEKKVELTKYEKFMKNIVQRYNEEKYWRYRDSVINNDIKIPKIIKIIRLYKIKKMDAFNNASLGTHLGYGATFKDIPKFPHGIRGIFVSHNAIIGKNCTIFHQVTIGEGKNGAPIIGNNCYIGAGAKIIGRIKIGDNVNIGAGCIVNEDIPSNRTVVMHKPRVIERSNKV